MGIAEALIMNRELKLISKKLTNLVVELAHGDISEAKADAIINAANNELWMGAGVAGALKRRGGTEIEKEAMEKGPVETGAAVFTKAGNLDAKHVIHAAVMGADLRTNENYIKEALYNSLAMADALNDETVAVPALGTGVGGFPIKRCAEVMLGVICQFDKEARKNPKRVVIVLFTPMALKEFMDVYRTL